MALDCHVKELKSPGSLLICCRPTVCLIGAKDGKKITVIKGKYNEKKRRCNKANSQSQRPRGLRRGSAAARLLKLWVRIPPGAWLCVSCECCVLSGSGLCDGPISHSEESYWLWCVVMCDLETSWMRRPCPALGRSATRTKSKDNRIYTSTSVINKCLQ